MLSRHTVYIYAVYCVGTYRHQNAIRKRLTCNELNRKPNNKLLYLLYLPSCEKAVVSHVHERSHTHTHYTHSHTHTLTYFSHN